LFVAAAGALTELVADLIGSFFTNPLITIVQCIHQGTHHLGVANTAELVAQLVDRLGPIFRIASRLRQMNVVRDQVAAVIAADRFAARLRGAASGRRTAGARCGTRRWSTTGLRGTARLRGRTRLRCTASRRGATGRSCLRATDGLAARPLVVKSCVTQRTADHRLAAFGLAIHRAVTAFLRTEVIGEKTGFGGVVCEQCEPNRTTKSYPFHLLLILLLARTLEPKRILQ